MATRRRNVNTSSGNDREERHVPEEQKMGLEEKLDYIDREIRKLRMFCVNAGYSSAQIELFAKPFLQEKTRSTRKLWITRGLKLFAVLIAAFALFSVDPANRLIWALGRRGQISLLKVWDWTQLYQMDCFIENPFFQEEMLSEADCQICEGMKAIQHVQNVSAMEFVESYLRRDTPVLVEDGVIDWLDWDKFTLEYLSKMFNEHPVLSLYNGCHLRSSIKPKYGNHRPLLAQAAAGEISNFFFHWENCFREAAKVVRQMYRRPYFLPPAVELSDTNVLFISSNYSGKTNKEVHINFPMIMVMQMKGEVDIILEPNDPCEKVCTPLTTRLKAGQAVVATNFLWSVHYSPVGEGVNIGIGIGGNFD